MPAQLLALKAVHVAELVRTGRAVLVDIREADEFARRRIKGARSHPLSELSLMRLRIKRGQVVIFACQNGTRAVANAERLAGKVEDTAFIIDGGMAAWAAAGLPIEEKDLTGQVALMRQVQVVTGLVIMAGIILGSMVSPIYYAVAAVMAGSMAVGGATGFCCVERVLVVMPWNRPTHA